MKITAIYGTSHAGSTVQIARMLLARLPHGPGDVQEFFLPQDFGHFCTGCNACFQAPVPLCAQAHLELEPILAAMDEADLLLFASPTYVYHVTGAMKAFLDHFGCRWMIHRPNPLMFTKKAVLITTAAGGGMQSALNDLADSMFYWGVPTVLRYQKAVHALSWDRVSDSTKASISRDLDGLAAKARRPVGGPSPKQRMLFAAMARIQRKGGYPADAAYWNAQGWTQGRRPWKDVSK